MKESFKKNRKGIALMLCSAFCACIGQFLWKLSAQMGVYIALLGFGLYGIGALFMLIAYKYGSLSVLQPMQSVGYILSLLLGYFVLNENISLTQGVGVLIIMCGVTMIGGGDT